MNIRDKFKDCFKFEAYFDDELRDLVASSDKPETEGQGYCVYCGVDVRGQRCHCCKSTQYVVEGATTWAQRDRRLNEISHVFGANNLLDPGLF